MGDPNPRESRRMVRLLGIVVSLGLADSMNPSTIAPALLLASAEHARDQVLRFTAGVFVVYFLGGVAIALGPGQLVLSLVPHPDRDAKALLEVIAGLAMLIAGLLLWLHRDRLRQRLTDASPGRRSSALLGATITAIELPTAFPYFGAIAAIVGSGRPAFEQVILLLIFNICFVLPLLGIVAVLQFAGDRAEVVLTRGRLWLQRRWPVLLATAAFLAGGFAIALGATRLVPRLFG
jgi:cytochrome c biogenesis protein CcdA